MTKKRTPPPDPRTVRAAERKLATLASKPPAKQPAKKGPK